MRMCVASLIRQIETLCRRVVPWSIPFLASMSKQEPSVSVHDHYAYDLLSPPALMDLLHGPSSARVRSKMPVQLVCMAVFGVPCVVRMGDCGMEGKERVREGRLNGL